MKALRLISFLLMLCASVFCACTRQHSAFTVTNAPHHFRELTRIEALLESHPEMALDSVKSLKEKATTLAALDDNELRLREVQAQYKNRCLAEDSQDLAPVVAFYDSLAVLFPDDADLQFLRANAYYYKGVECDFANEDVAAFTHYLKALDVMRRHDDWGANPYAKRFTALTYTRLSEILYRYGLHDAAFESCQKASSFYENASDLAAMMRFEAAICQAQKQYDKALALYQEAEAKVSVGDDSLPLAIGSKYFEIQQFDSAYLYLGQAFQKGDRFARADAAAKLAEICRDKGWTDQELFYTRFYVENSMMETRMASRKMEIEYLYDDFSRSKITPETPKDESKPMLWVLAFFLLAIIGFMAYIIVRNRKRISHIESKITTIELKHEQENANKDHEIEQIAQQLNDTREKLNTPRIDFDVAWKAFFDSAIATKIRGMVEGKDIMIKSVGAFPKLKLKEVDYIELVRETNRRFPDFSSRFLKDFPDLNVADVRHSCLALLGLNDAEIAVLVGVSYSGTNRRTNKILSALGQDVSLEQALITYIKNNF